MTGPEDMAINKLNVLRGDEINGIMVYGETYKWCEFFD